MARRSWTEKVCTDKEMQPETIIGHNDPTLWNASLRPPQPRARQRSFAYLAQERKNVGELIFSKLWRHVCLNRIRFASDPKPTPNLHNTKWAAFSSLNSTRFSPQLPLGGEPPNLRLHGYLFEPPPLSPSVPNLFFVLREPHLGHNNTNLIYKTTHSNIMYITTPQAGIPPSLPHGPIIKRARYNSFSGHNAPCCTTQTWLGQAPTERTKELFLQTHVFFATNHCPPPRKEGEHNDHGQSFYATYRPQEEALPCTTTLFTHTQGYHTHQNACKTHFTKGNSALQTKSASAWGHPSVPPASQKNPRRSAQQNAPAKNIRHIDRISRRNYCSCMSMSIARFGLGGMLGLKD